MRRDHYNASRLVRYWDAKPIVAGLVHPTEFGPEGESFRLQFPGGGYVVRVVFSKLDNHPDKMRVRSTNWRCEHEPNGIYRIEDARLFYARLIQAGFELEESA